MTRLEKLIKIESILLDKLEEVINKNMVDEADRILRMILELETLK